VAKRSKSGLVLLLCVVVCVLLIVYLNFIPDSEESIRSMILIMLFLVPCVAFRFLCIPTVLFLAASSKKSAPNLRHSTLVFVPYRIVSLVRKVGKQQIFFDPQFNSLRTWNDDEWKEQIEDLCQLARFIVLDVTELTENVDFEVNHLIFNNLLSKTIVVSRENQYRPVNLNDSCSGIVESSTVDLFRVLKDRLDHARYAISRVARLHHEGLLTDDEFRSLNSDFFETGISNRQINKSIRY